MKNKINWIFQIITVCALYFPLKSIAQENKATAAIQQIIHSNLEHMQHILLLVPSTFFPIASASQIDD
jgi:hypothetical protein